MIAKQTGGSLRNYTEEGSVLPTASVPSADAHPSPDGRRLRSDAQRNHARLLAAAVEAFAEQGPDTSLEDVARRAGVGIGTLYRHFPTRHAIMAAVVRDRIEGLGESAEALLAAPDPWTAVTGWLRDQLDFGITKRGLVAAVVILKQEGEPEFLTACTRMVDAGGALVARAQGAGVLRPDARAADLLRLVSAIAGAAEQSPEGAALGHRLLDIALDGLRPQAPPARRPVSRRGPARRR